MNTKDFLNEYDSLLDELFKETIASGKYTPLANGCELFDVGHIKPKTENSFISDIDVFYTIKPHEKENISTFYYVPVGDHFDSNGKFYLCFLEVTTNKLDKDKFKLTAASALYDAYCEYKEKLSENE